MGKQTHRPAEEFTFENEDMLGLKSFAERLLQYLEVDHHFAANSLVISLDAPFGSGKTTFLNMWKNFLLAKRNNDSNSALPVLINAWEDDFCGDPMLSLLISLLDAVRQDRPSDPSGHASKLTDAAKQIAWFAVGLGNSLVNKFTGLDPVAAAALAESRSGKQSLESVPDMLRLFEERKLAFVELKQALRESFGGDRIKAVIIIDELDRCRPDYAVSFLETIKHIFDIPGMVFVLAIDRDHLANSAKSLFGADLNTSEYLRKFIARSFEFPRPGDRVLHAFVGHQIQRFMSLPDVRDTTFQGDFLVSTAKELCGEFNLTLRQIEEFFRIAGHVFSTTERGRFLARNAPYAMLLLCLLKVVDNSLYRAIGRNSVSTKAFAERLIDLGRITELMRWTALYHTGRSGGHDEGNNFELAWSSVRGDKPPTRNSPAHTLVEVEQGWGIERGIDYIHRIFQAIETAVGV